MRHIVFTPAANHIGNDYKGAFSPESKRYVDYWKGKGDEVFLYKVDATQSYAERRAAMLEAIEAKTPIDRLVYFCHGWRTGLQLGLSIEDSRSKEALHNFIVRLAANATPSLKVALYACSTGASADVHGDGGFADTMRDELCAAGKTDVVVFAHTSAGHTTRNSNIRFFAGKGNAAGGIGGDDVIARKTPEAKRLYARLHDGNDDFRWRLPYMTPAEVFAELQ